MLKIENPIEELTKRINDHLSKGGSIYDEKRKQPYYDYLIHVKKQLSKKDGIEYSKEDIYKLCGFEYDFNYDNFLNLKNIIINSADDGKYIDKTSTFKKKCYQNYNDISHLATKYNACIYDFIVIMTGFRLSEANIYVDYEKALKKMLLKAYPLKDLLGIRRNNPELYEMIRHLKKYRYPELKTEEVVDILGFTNSKKAPVTKTKIIDKKLVIKELKAKFPDLKIQKNIISNTKIYYEIVKLSILEKKSIVDWLTENGFTYIQGNLVERLHQMKVNEKSRYNYLIKKQKEFYKTRGIDIKHISEKDKFYLDLKCLEEIVNLENSDEYIDYEINNY